MKRNLRSLLLWSVIISFLIFLTMSFFHSVLQYQQQIMGMVKLVPVAAMKARGFGNISDIFSGLGFYAANNIVYMELLGSIFSMVLGANILMKEEYGKTAEYLMSRPVSRTEIFSTKFFLAFMNIFLLNLVTSLIGLISLLLFKSGELHLRPYFILVFYTLLLNLFFGSLGLLVAALHKRARHVTFLCVGIVLVCYFIYTISRIQGIDGDWGYITPFKWVSIDLLVPGYGIKAWSLFLFLGTTAFMVLSAGLVYRRKDILT